MILRTHGNPESSFGIPPRRAFHLAARRLNLSRLSSQWEERINDALWRVDREAGRRLDDFIGALERLVENGGNGRAPRIRADLERIDGARKRLISE